MREKLLFAVVYVEHPTYVSSLDVRVLGDAGGSMVRANKSGVIDVGPRSAHIAGVEYGVFTDPDKIVNGKVEFFSPKPGDPDDYVAIRLGNGERITLTNTCAANALGILEPGDLSYGNVEAARKAIKVLADFCGTTLEDIATQIMDRAIDKIKPVFASLVEKYKLEKKQMSLVGVGGGAAVLVKSARFTMAEFILKVCSLIQRFKLPVAFVDGNEQRIG